MGESDRYQDYKKVKRRRFTLGQDSNAVMNLFVLNVIFFLILMCLQVAFYFYQQTPQVFYTQVVQWFELPANITRLSERPWTLVTYMFTETGASLIRLMTNMIWLWAFGYLLQGLAGNDKIIPIYIYGGVTGGIFFIVANYSLPALHAQVDHAAMLGANAGTMAVAMATTTLAPNHRFFTRIRGGIPIWILMGLYLLIDFAGVSGASAAYSLAHLGGAIAGFVFILLLRKGHDGSLWMNSCYRWVTTLFTPKNTPSKPPTKERLFYESGNRKPFNKSSIVTQQRVDEILDKISLKGYHFLTEEEKNILKKAAEEEGF